MAIHDTPTILIILGITGDLSTRYLLPSIEEIAEAGELPASFHLVGTSRREIDAHTLLDSQSKRSFLANHLSLQVLDPVNGDDYAALDSYLTSIEAEWGTKAQRLYYLSVPPQVAWPVVELIGKSSLSKHPHTKLLLEKPFGVDLASAENLIMHAGRYFTEEQIYRIDHYLAKEMAQNLVVFRQANPLFSQTWNAKYIERIDITAAESIDIEGRAAFYEQTGALRDIVQSHALQLAALTLMDVSEHGSMSIPAARLAALKQLHLAPANEKPVYRAQYEGYRNDVSNMQSTVETFVRISLQSSAPAWQGVPIYLTSGKALPEKLTAITLTYRSESGHPPNQLIMRIQPKAGIELQLWAKKPGYERRQEQRTLEFNYPTSSRLPDAYEQVLLDAIRSDHTLFTSGDEVRESWRILQPILDTWAMDENDLPLYAKGTHPSVE